MYNRRKLQWHVRGLLLHSCSVCRGWFLITLLPLNVAWFVRVWLTIRWHNMTIVMIKTGLGARLTRTSPEATKKTRANLFKWIHIHILRTQHSINTQSLKHIGEHRPMEVGKMRSDSERDHWLRAVNRWLAGGAVKPMNDGAAFILLLCLSQLCYIMASNTWANSVLRKCHMLQTHVLK